MTRVLSHHPQFWHFAAFFAAYVLGCGFAQALAIVPGTGISIWPPSGLFMATLVFAPRRSWPWWVLGGLLSELFANVVWFHNPLPVAILINAGNALEAMVGAWLITRICGQTVRLESLQDVLGLVILGAGVAPVASATVGSATLAWFGVQSFTAAWPLFWLGDATGVLIVMPLALVVFQNWRVGPRLPDARWIEACVLGLIFLGVSALSLSGHLASAYVVMPPLLWAAVRFEFRGAAVALALLALITVVFTLSGASQFVGDLETQRQEQVMLQLFLVISAFSVLIVAAISRQHQQALLALGQRERQLHQMIDTLPVRIWSATATGESLYFNKRYQDQFRAIPNFEPAQAKRIERLVQELAYPDDAPGLLKALRHSFETGDPSVLRFRWREREDDYRWAECRVEPRHDEDGTIAEWYGVSIDIDDEMRAQQALRDRERELSTLVDMIPSHLWRVTPEGETTLANKHMADFFGLDMEDKQRLDDVFSTMFHPDEADEVWDVFERCLRTGEPFSMNYRMRRYDGVYRWMSGRAVPMRDEDGRIVQWFGLCHDIDDQVHAEEGLRRASDKLARATQAASLAELSASIAHEVNQPLAAIVANSQACHRWLSAEPPNVERAKITTERITRDANSASDVVRHIRALFSQTEHVRLPDDINRLINEVCRLMADETAAKGTRIKVKLEPDLPPVVLDRIQVQQVLVNLIRNGIEAMDTVTHAPKELQIRSFRDGPGAIRIEVRDAGMGFADTERAFEPFFTTKRNGMGMGLAICRSIVESHGGRLWTANNETRGAAVAFTLPLAIAEAAQAHDADGPDGSRAEVRLSAVQGAESAGSRQGVVGARDL
ncbi:MASE1 domain-containing protein [Ensifer adhaerens]|uniref:MASE1 domain-containing protein n=1 Tax=Ensifer adhaerens TaxID=106592 RepID=UPI0009900C36|nr:MASE1 domain-containing protein [Ensifer adhaerens]